MSAAAYAPRILSPDQIFTGFDAVAPIVKMSDSDWPKMMAQLSKEEGAVAAFWLYFYLGVRWREHVMNYDAHAQLLDAAAEPDSPTIAIPGIDFSTDQVIADLRKAGKL